MARINVLQVRQAALGGPAIKPWLAFKGFCWECTPSDYYTERVFHLALAGATDFYCARMSLRLVCESSATLTHPCLRADFFAWTVGIDGYRVKLADHSLLSAVLAELSELVGCEDRQWVVDEMPRWNDDFMVSVAAVGFLCSCRGSDARPLLANSSRAWTQAAGACGG